MNEVGIDKGEVRAPELKLAMQLIQQITSDKFDPSAYQDEEKKRIQGAIQKKIEGEQIAVSPEPSKGGAQIIDLMDALRASLEKGGTQAPAQKATERKPPKRVTEAKPVAQKVRAGRK
jgi:DNA end-binding protein Ku